MPDTTNNIRQLSLAQSKAYAGFAAGLSLSDIAKQAGISRQTLHSWLKSDQTFIRAAAVARQEYLDTFRDRLFSLTRKALHRLEMILEDSTVPPSVALKASLAVLNRPESGWNLPPVPPSHQADFQNPPVPEPNLPKSMPPPEPEPAAAPAPATGQNLTPQEPVAAPPTPEPIGQNLTPSRQIDPLDQLLLKTFIAANSSLQKTPLPGR